MPILLTALLCTLFLVVGIVYFASRISGYRHRRHTISELGEIGGPYSRLVGMGLAGNQGRAGTDILQRP